MNNVAQKIYFGMDVSDKFVEIFALTPDDAKTQRIKIENNRKSLYLILPKYYQQGERCGRDGKRKPFALDVGR